MVEGEGEGLIEEKVVLEQYYDRVGKLELDDVLAFLLAGGCEGIGVVRGYVEIRVAAEI